MPILLRQKARQDKNQDVAMTPERTLSIERTDRSVYLKVQGSISPQEYLKLPRPQHTGSEGPSTINPDLYDAPGVSVLGFEAWVFGTNPDKLADYTTRVAEHLGATVSGEAVQVG